MHRAIAGEGLLESAQNVLFPVIVFELRKVLSGVVELFYSVLNTRVGEFLRLVFKCIKKSSAAVRTRHSSELFIPVKEGAELGLLPLLEERDSSHKDAESVLRESGLPAVPSTG